MKRKIGLNAGYIHFIIIQIKERISDRLSKEMITATVERKDTMGK
jgi:hypothetical protein